MVTEKQKLEHRKDNVVFGSIIGMIAFVIAGLLFYFGSGKETLWLCVVGFVILAVGILSALADTSNGLTVILTIVLVAGVLHFFGEKLGTDHWFTKWVFEENLRTVFYVARLCIVGMIVSIIGMAVSINNARHSVK